MLNLGEHVNGIVFGGFEFRVLEGEEDKCVCVFVVAVENMCVCLKRGEYES